MKNTILITGGAGFIGVNSAQSFASKGWQVIVLDNLSRKGTELNLHWLQEQHDVLFERADDLLGPHVLRRDTRELQHEAERE